MPEQAKSTFQPIVPASQTMAEFTIPAVILGAILGIIFGAANVYLALNVGLTVSASIPVAVISMGILRGILKRGTILENNMVQTVGSAGESLAAGVVFTVPALIIWGHDPSLFYIFSLSLLGGLLGVLFMIPLRGYLMVEEHERLPYPEGTACAEVLQAGQEGGQKAMKVFMGLGLGAVYTFLMKGLGLWPDSPHFSTKRMPSMEVGIDNLPALLGVGYIIGPRIAGIMLAGGTLGWLVLIPAIAVFGSAVPDPIYPAEKTLIAYMEPIEIWNYYIRYIGAGAVAFGGLISLIKSAPTIFRSFKLGIAKLAEGSKTSVLRTEKDLPTWFVLGGIAIVALLIWILPTVPVGLLGTLLIVIFSFFFVTVSSRIVGLIGSSSNPASGMTIATLLSVTFILLWAGYSGEAGKIAAISCGAIVCIGICIAGDTSQDLKTGFLLGATPWRQQIGEFIGVIVAALFIGGTLFILNEGYGIGPSPEKLSVNQAEAMLEGEGFFNDSERVKRLWKAEEKSRFADDQETLFGLKKKRFWHLPLGERLKRYVEQEEGESTTTSKRLKAPQATLMAMVIEGVMNANLPWALILIGMFAALVVEFLGVPALPFAVGLYLPLSLSTPIMIGGLLAGWSSRFAKEQHKEARRENGILTASGLIAGEAVIGIFLAILAWQNIHLDAASGWLGSWGNVGSLLMFGVLVFLLIKLERSKG